MAKCFEYEIIYDWHDRNGFFPVETTLHEVFDGTCEELSKRIKDLADCGGKNIFFNLLGPVEETEELQEEVYEVPRRGYFF